jgi:hypothetical protein
MVQFPEAKVSKKIYLLCVTHMEYLQQNTNEEDIKYFVTQYSGGIPLREARSLFY